MNDMYDCLINTSHVKSFKYVNYPLYNQSLVVNYFNAVR